MDVSPLDEYAQRKAARHATVAARERAHLQLGNAKVTLFLAAIAYGAYALGNDPSAIIFGLGAAVFVALSVWHELVLRALARARAAVAYYEDGVARIEDRWMRPAASASGTAIIHTPTISTSSGRAACFSCCRRAARRWVRHGSPRGCCARLHHRRSAIGKHGSRHCAIASIFASASPWSTPGVVRPSMRIG
jgi:hypothetical protein